MNGRVFRQLNREEIREWYSVELPEAFSENERKPLEDIFALIEQERYEIWGLFAEGKMLGYAALWKRPGTELVLLDYLGVTAELRNGGLGSEILSLLKDQGFPLVLESEVPVRGACEEDNALRERRIGFYVRNGFAPAYEMATCGTRWKALIANAEGFPIEEIMRMHRELYGPERADVKVPLGPDEKPEMPYWMN